MLRDTLRKRGSDIVNEIFESQEVVTSHWTLAVAAIDKKVAKKQITEEERDFSISVLFSDVLGKVTFVKLSDEFLYPVIEKVLSHHISANEEGLETIDVENPDDRRRLKETLK